VCGAKEPLLREPHGVEDRAAQGQRAFEPQKRRHPRLHQTARIRGLDVHDEISKSRPQPSPNRHYEKRYERKILGDLARALPRGPGTLPSVNQAAMNRR
jgi:hypothetical protein